MILFKKRLLPMVFVIVTSVMATAQAQLSDGSQVDEEIVVQGVRGADINAREAERGKDIFSSIITQDDAGNFADQNVAESLQRLPGITLQKEEGEGKFINLRGLGPGFVSVNMNGAELANSSGGSSTEDDADRGYSLDALPADVLASIEVLKTLTPDMDLNSIGGVVNVRTVSPFDKGRNSLNMSAQGAYQDFAADFSPKFTLRGTNLFANDTFGIGYSASYEERATRVYETRTHDTSIMRYIQAAAPGLPTPTESSPRMLVPWELQNRQEDAQRERIAVLTDFAYKPNDNSEYFLRLGRTKFTDDDIAMREYYRFAQGTPESDEVPYLDPVNNVFGVTDAELQHQHFIQRNTRTDDVVSVGGENLFDEGWALDYELTQSTSESDSPDNRRVQFRIQDLPVLGSFGSDFVNGQVITQDHMRELSEATSLVNASGATSANYQFGEVSQPNMLYDNIFIEDVFRKETLDQARVNLRKDFSAGILSYVKAGFQIKNREQDNDKNRVSIVPDDYRIVGCAGDLDCLTLSQAGLGDFETFIPDHPGFDHAIITRSEAERLIEATRPIADTYDPDQSEQESRRLDYNLNEDTSAVYFMAEFQLSDNQKIITGARYEQTEFLSTGNFTIRNDRFEAEEEVTSLDIVLPLQGTKNSYSDLFPSIHYLNDIREDLLLRTALWTSFSRPSFGQSKSFVQVIDRVSLCNTDPSSSFFGQCGDDPRQLGAQDLQDVEDFFVFDSANTIRVGNPNLEAMTSVNFDASLAWYASEDLYLQGAIFYKDISDFIVEASGLNLSWDQLPVTVPVSQVTAFSIPTDATIENVSTFINGDNARVYGLEISYNQYFTQGLLSGFFVQSNMTLLDSKANVGDTVRSEEIQLPEQSDVTLNLTIGWENDDISLRFISNYRSELLKRIGSCTADDVAADIVAGFPESCQKWADIYQDESVTFDFKASYQITDDLKFYFDAVNITDEVDIYYYQGNQFSNGNVLFRSERYGNSYQVGLSYTFM